MESAKDVGKNMSKAREAWEVVKNQTSNMSRLYSSDSFKVVEELVDRDEHKPVLHENVMKQFGKCPVCNSSVAIQFHSDFCGKCGNRLKWRGETI